jgi:predicted secreted protein
MQRFDDPGQVINATAGEVFEVRLAGNPTTGFLWEAKVDANALELVSQGFEPAGEAVGAGGQEVFRFHALAAGETQIAFAYRRPWYREARETRRFRVTIT